MSTPRVAAIHDMSGFGRCSLTVALPILSAMGIQCCPLPTAFLSTHTGGFQNFTFLDMTDELPIDPQCDCPVCRRFSRAYIRHLFVAEEMLAMRLAVMHNLYFYNKLMERIRMALDEGTFSQFRAEYSEKLARRI